MANILIVEDDNDVFQMFSHLLESQGHKLARVVDPCQLYSVLDGFKPDLVILDIQLPAGGAPLAQRILDNKIGALTPTLLCSGMPVKFQKDWFPETPLRRYAAKPVNLAEFKALINDLLAAGASREACHA